MRKLQEIVNKQLNDHLYTVVHRRESSLEKYLQEDIADVIHNGMYHQLADQIHKDGKIIVNSKSILADTQIECTLRAVVVPPYEILHLVEKCIREMSIEEIHQIRATK